jgi:hypothetical protein
MSMISRTRFVIVAALAIAALSAVAWIAMPDADTVETTAGQGESGSRHAPVASPSRPSLAAIEARSAAAPDHPPMPADPRKQLARALESDVPISPNETVVRIERGLAATGESREPWTHDAGKAFSALEAEMRGALKDDRFRVSSPQCFAAGCVVTVEYPPGSDVPVLAQTIVTSSAIAAWPGAKLASPAVTSGGDVIANRWVLLRPDSL